MCKTVLCPLDCKKSKTNPGLEFGPVWWPIVVFYGMVILLMVCNMVVYSVVVLLVVGELPAAITGSHTWSRIYFRTIFGKIFS